MNDQILEDSLNLDALDVSFDELWSESEEPEVLAESLNSTAEADFDWFDESEKTANLDSDSSAINNRTDEQPEANESEIIPDELPLPLPTANEAPLTQSTTVGNPEGTQFTFNFAEDTPHEVIEGVKQAAENWSSVLKDNAKINIDFEFAPDQPDILGGALSNQIPLPYEVVNQALAEDVTSGNDQTAVANLPGDSINVLINNTSENNGSDTPYLDSNGGLNNSFIMLNTANAKALGLSLEDLAESFGTTPEVIATELDAVSDNYLVNTDTVDASLKLNSEINWDFDPSDGISADATDFIGTVTHELGHALGFGTNAEDLDMIADPNFDVLDVIELAGSEEINESIAASGLDILADAVNVDQFVSENGYLLQTLDLFRFTPESFEEGARDYTTGNIDEKYFSIDGGQTAIAPLSTGTLTGDGRQLSHWEDDLVSGVKIGIMDPTGMLGELDQISDTDLLALDVIGWDTVDV